MLKSILSFFILMAVISATAQDGYWSKTKIGFVVGPKFSSVKTKTIDPNNSFSYSDKGSFNFGFNLTTKVHKKLCISYGATGTFLNIERKDKCITCDQEVAQTNNISYRYLTIPVQAQIYFQSDRLDIFGIIGMNYNLMTKSKGNYVTSTGNSYNLVNLSEQTSKSLMGGEAGLGIDYNLTYRASLRLNVTYQMFFGNFTKMPTSQLSAVNVQPGIFYQF